MKLSLSPGLTWPPECRIPRSMLAVGMARIKSKIGVMSALLIFRRLLWLEMTLKS